MKMRNRPAALALFVLGCIFGYVGHHAGDARPAAAADECQAFQQTNHSVCGLFLTYWRTHGGLAQQGYPVSDVFQEVSATDGQSRDVQYFERAVFERHPENAGTQYEVLLSLLGSEKYNAKYPGGQGTTREGSVGVRTVRGETAITVMGVKRDAAPVDQFGRTYTPRAGFVVLSVDLVEENTGASAHRYDVLNYTLKDGDGFGYEHALGFYGNFVLIGGNLHPGEKVRGIVPFEVREGATGLTLGYIYKDQDGTQIHIRLD